MKELSKTPVRLKKLNSRESKNQDSNRFKSSFFNNKDSAMNKTNLKITDSKISFSRSNSNPNLHLRKIPQQIRVAVNTSFNPLTKENMKNKDKMVDQILNAFMGEAKPKISHKKSRSRLPISSSIPKLPIFGGDGPKSHETSRLLGKGSSMVISQAASPRHDRFREIISNELHSFVGVYKHSCREFCPHLIRFYQRLAALFENMLMEEHKNKLYVKVNMNKVNIDRIQPFDSSKLTEAIQSFHESKKARKDAGANKRARIRKQVESDLLKGRKFHRYYNTHR